MSACSVLSSLKKTTKKKQRQQKYSLSFHVSVFFFNVNKLKKKASGQCKLTFLIANTVVISLKKKVSFSSFSSCCCCCSSSSCSSSSYFSSSPSSSLFFFFFFFFFYIIVFFFFFFLLHFRLQILSFKIDYCSINSITDTIAASK